MKSTCYQSDLISAEVALEELRSQGKELGVFANLTLLAPPTPAVPGTSAEWASPIAPEAPPATAPGPALPIGTQA